MDIGYSPRNKIPPRIIIIVQPYLVVERLSIRTRFSMIEIKDFEVILVASEISNSRRFLHLTTKLSTWASWNTRTIKYFFILSIEFFFLHKLTNFPSKKVGLVLKFLVPEVYLCTLLDRCAQVPWEQCCRVYPTLEN